MAETAFVVRVPEAEALVAGLRERFDPSAQLGVPAHITVLAPFMPPESVTADALEQARSALDSVGSFSFKLASVGRFTATAYLAPEPAESFVALTEALVHRFATYPPFRGEHASIVPHLTVANGNAADAEVAAIELDALLGVHGPVRGHCAAVALLENSSGLWKELHVLTLRQRDDDACVERASAVDASATGGADGRKLKSSNSEVQI